MDHILPRPEFPDHEVPCSELSQVFFCSPIFRFVYHVYLLVLCTKILLLISFYWIINFNNHEDDDDDDDKSLSQYTM